MNFPYPQERCQLVIIRFNGGTCGYWAKVLTWGAPDCPARWLQRRDELWGTPSEPQANKGHRPASHTFQRTSTNRCSRITSSVHVSRRASGAQARGHCVQPGRNRARRVGICRHVHRATVISRAPQLAGHPCFCISCPAHIRWHLYGRSPRATAPRAQPTAPTSREIK